jgi:hypothetical protein
VLNPSVAACGFESLTGILFTLGTLLSMLFVPISVSWFWSTQYPGLESFD